VAVRSHRLVGRDEELDSLVRLLDAPDELPAAAAILGEAGIGKTALWLAAIEAAAARGYRVLSCRPFEAEVRFSFSGVADLLGGLVAEVLPELPPPQRRALEVALALSDSGDPVEERLVAFAFLNALRRLGERNPLLLAVDDVQWLDAPSLALLRYALPRFESEPVAAVLTARGEFPAWLRRDVAAERLLELDLGTLSVGALHELLRGRLDVAFTRPVLMRVWEVSGGNPFFALEIARALQRSGGSLLAGEELQLSSSLDELVDERLAGLGDSATEVVQVVAALAEPTSALVEAAAGARAERGVAEAVEDGVLVLEGDRLRFSHPLLGSAASSRLTQSERRSLHARLAELVPGAEERARHLGVAAAGPSREAAAALDEAAQAAHLRGAPAVAVELAEQAVQLTPESDAEDRRRRVIFAADRLDAVGDSRGAVVLLEQARDLAPPGPARAAVLVRLALLTRASKGWHEALALCQAALVEAEGDDAVEARAHFSIAEILRFHGREGERGLKHAELAVLAAERAGDPLLRCEALAQFGLMHFVAGRGVPRAEMEEALALERSLEGPLTDAATWTVAHQLVWSGEDFERGRRHLHEYREALRARGDDVREVEPLWGLSVLEWRAGNWDLAARRARDLLSLAAQTGAEGEEPVGDLAPAVIAAHRGQVVEARAIAERVLARAGERGNRRAQAMHLWVLGFIELSRDDPAAALDHLRPAWEIYDELGYFEPGHRLELADTLEALIAVGELDEAERRLVPWEERARALDRAWAIAITARCRARLLAVRGDLEGAFAAFGDALVAHERSVYPFEHARTLLALGATQRRAKRRAAARATLEQALGIFERLGAPLWAEKTRAELARVGGRSRSGGELTESERRIAALVGEGRSNREVAAALFLTEHTVETALSRVYRKLGVRSRTELANRLARQTGEPPPAKT
jgi:DNA-binding CsgD family transcriptional regulator